MCIRDRIIALLIRITEALLAISLLVAALTLLITVLLESALLVSSIIGAIAVLLLSLIHISALHILPALGGGRACSGRSACEVVRDYDAQVHHPSH